MILRESRGSAELLILLGTIFALPILVPAMSGKSGDKKSDTDGEEITAPLRVECARCQAEIPMKSRYCPNCGEELRASKTRFCPPCGIELPAGSKFCAGCGGAAYRSVDDLARTAPVTIDPAEPTPKIVEQETYVIPPPLPKIPGRDSFPRHAEEEIEREHSSEPSLLRSPEMHILPPRLFHTPTAEILPSLHVHMGSGWTFGLSGEGSRNRWVMSVGLGGISEVILASQRIEHITAPESNALAGFRLKLPVSWMGDAVSRHLMLAANVAATRDNHFSAPTGFPADEGPSVSSLSYDYRETTVGIVGTWKTGHLRLHGAAHLSDLRTDNAVYEMAGQKSTVDNSKNIRPTFGFGLDYKVNSQTYFLAEVRSLPRISFSADPDRFELKSRPEYSAGVRFYPVRPIALDALVSIDGEAEGPADMEIGVGLGFLFGLPGSRQEELNGENAPERID